MAYFFFQIFSTLFQVSTGIQFGGRDVGKVFPTGNHLPGVVVDGGDPGPDPWTPPDHKEPTPIFGICPSMGTPGVSPLGRAYIQGFRRYLVGEAHFVIGEIGMENYKMGVLTSIH